MSMRPLGERVLVKCSKAEDTTPGGIVIPDVAQERPSKGIVVAVGPGKRLDDGTRAEMEVAAGDEVVCCGSYFGTEVKIGGESHTLIDEKDILAVIEKE